MSSKHANLAVLTFTIAVMGFIISSSNPVLSQTCTQPFTLRQEVCPSGLSTCTTKASTLTYQELDRDIINTVNMCNGPGKFTWPATGSAGIFSVTSGGIVSIAVDDDQPDNDSEVPDAITVSGGTVTASTLSGTNTVTGILNLDSGTEGHLIFPASTTLPATCTLGDSYWDTDADTDGSFYICRATNTWKEVDDDGGAGGGAPVDALYLTLSSNATLTNERTYTTGVGLNGTDGGAGSTFTIAFWTGDTLISNPAYAAEDVVFTKDSTGGGLLFEGSTADTIEGILVWNPTTTDRTLILPDTTGTLISTADTGSVTGTMILDNTIGLATDTVGNYAAGDAEAGNATGLVCTTCVGTTDVANDAITYAKIQNVTEGKLLGRSTAGSGDIEEITVGANLNLSDGTLSASGGGSAPDTLTTPVLGDEFCTRHSAENVYGDLGWRLYGSNATSISGDTGHPCIQSLFTTTVSGNIQSIGLSSNSDSDLIRVADIDRVSFLVKVNSVSNVEYRMGLMDQVDSTTGGDGFFIELDTSASAAWRCITRQGGTTTATNNGAGSVAIDTWYLLEIERDVSNNHKCYVNGVSFATHTTNLPTGLYNGGIMVQTNDMVQKILYIDAFRAKFKTLTRY